MQKGFDLMTKDQVVDALKQISAGLRGNSRGWYDDEVADWLDRRPRNFNASIPSGVGDL